VDLQDKVGMMENYLLLSFRGSVDSIVANSIEYDKNPYNKNPKNFAKTELKKIRRHYDEIPSEVIENKDYDFQYLKIIKHLLQKVSVNLDMMKEKDDGHLDIIKSSCETSIGLWEIYRADLEMYKHDVRLERSSIEMNQDSANIVNLELYRRKKGTG